MRVEFAASVAKDANTDGLNEDCYLFSLDRSIAAVSDGASESFDSRSWAAILCELSCSGEGVTSDTISQAARQYGSLYDPQLLSWSKAAAYERGSFATLLSLRHNRLRSEVEVLGIGDTVLLLWDGKTVVRRFPLTRAEHFDARPQLLSTRAELNTFLHDPFFNTSHVMVDAVTPITVALVLTDALGSWCYKALDEGRDDWLFLLSVDTEDAFREFVWKARGEKRLKVDDTTLMRLSFGTEA
jgi:hypothetical protein